MQRRSDEEERKLREQVEKAKPGFIPVRQVRDAPNEPAAPVNSGTPDTSVLKAKAQEFTRLADSSDVDQSTDALRRKFLPDRGDDNPGRAAASRGAKPNSRSSAAEVKGNPQIVTVRPTRGADSDEGVPPKDIQMVMDDEGQIGESS